METVSKAQQDARPAQNVAPQSRRLDKKSQILDVASEWFLAHGYAGTSISAMARESGISKESIYRYFSSKEVLLEAVIEKELEFYGRELESADAVEIGRVDLREALIRIAETIAFTLNSDRTLDFRRLIFQESRTSPKVGEHYFEVGPLQAEVPLVEVFTAHREETDFEPDVLATYFAAMVGHRPRSRTRMPRQQAQRRLRGPTLPARIHHSTIGTHRFNGSRTQGLDTRIRLRN